MIIIIIIIINCPQAVQAEKYKDKIFGFFLALLCKEGQIVWYYSFFPGNTKFCIIINYIKIIF